MYNSARMIGVTIGIIVGLILTIFVIRYVNRNKKLTTKYDEMQKQIRGEGYKYAFYAVLILEAVLCVLTMGIVLPAEPYVVHFFAIFVGITVQACYCIWRGAYIGQNTNLQRYVILMAIVSVFNLSSAVESGPGRPGHVAGGSCRSGRSLPADDQRDREGRLQPDDQSVH